MATERKIAVDPSREDLEAEIARLREQLAAAPKATAAAPPPEPEATKADDIVPVWTFPVELAGRNLLDRDLGIITVHAPNGKGRHQEFIPGMTYRDLRLDVIRNVLSIASAAADQSRLNLINRGQTIQNPDMYFDA